MRMSQVPSKAENGSLHSPFRRPGLVAGALACREVKLEKEGFYNRWFLGSLGPVQL